MGDSVQLWQEWMEIPGAFSTKNYTKRMESAGYFSHSLKTGPEGSEMKQVVLVEAILAEHGINVPEAPRSTGQRRTGRAGDDGEG